MKHRLIETASGAEVKPGMRLVDFRKDIWELVSFRAPSTGASTGRVIVRKTDGTRECEFYPHVFDLKIVEAE